MQTIPLEKSQEITTSKALLSSKIESKVNLQSSSEIPSTTFLNFTPNNNVLSILKDSKVPQTVINEKIQRCNDFRFGKYGNIPLCFKENSPKEELVLEHVIQYKRQFQLVYNAEDRDLLLFPKNECEVYKFICTTIRPTKLGYLELYKYEECARYLSQFLAYEELDPPDRFPTVIPSPSNILAWQKGDCFDFAILLCSMLIGVGYDAYCVYGIAPREVTTKNESLMVNPYIKKGELIEKEEIIVVDLSKTNDFAIQRKPEIHSKFDKKQDEERKQLEEERRFQAMNIDDDEPDELTPDLYVGKRLHCWVLVKKGKRDIQENVFIEPTTGRIYPIEHSPYMSVDCVFSNRNFWINMRADSEVKELNFDSLNTSPNWEFVMLDTLVDVQKENQDVEEGEKEEDYTENPSPTRSLLYDSPKRKLSKRMSQRMAKLSEDYGNEDGEEYINEMGELDMPPPWPPKLDIDKESFLKLSPLGENQIFYHKSRVDTYSPYGQPDGLVQRITIYKDYKRLKVKEIRYFYEHRSDKLAIRHRFPFEFKTVEEYEPGKPPHWKQVIEIDRKLRVIKFYPNRNVDGLIMREERIGTKTIEFYQHRDDRVVYRSVRFESKKEISHKDCAFVDNHIGNVVITKMTQKFEKDQNKPANEQIAKMIIDLIKGKVMVYYHMNEGEISPIYKEYNREHMQGFGKFKESSDKKGDDPIVQQQNQKMLGMEKECIQQIKLQESTAKEDEKSVREDKIMLEKTLYDKARDKYKENLRKKDDESGKNADVHDYLYPFLEKAGFLNKNLSMKEALEIKNDVMKKLKERLLSRAEIIQKRLEKEREQLEKQETMMQKRGEHISKEEEKQYEEIINQLNFKINILDQRMTRFEAMALQKFAEMDQKLNDDNRLAALKQK